MVSSIPGGIIDKNDVITEVFKSRMILAGSPTINRGISVAVAGILEEIEGLRFKNKKAAAFGTYGWSGESVDKIGRKLKDAGFELVHDGQKSLWNPSETSLLDCRDFGREIAKAL